MLDGKTSRPISILPKRTYVYDGTNVAQNYVISTQPIAKMFKNNTNHANCLTFAGIYI